jgi:uracil-DNA glycosylase
MNVRIDPSRYAVLSDEFAQDYFVAIKNFLLKEKEDGKIIYPTWLNVFHAFDMTPFDKVKVVILGQDPYHGVWQAHGLSFSVPDGLRQPPSLQNIFKEISSDLWIAMSTNWNLTRWAEQGVLLLNAFLTVRASEPASHQKIGRELFTDAVIRVISDKKEHVVFLLRWAFAQSKASLINQSKHLVLQAPHPSPFSVHKWFFGCKHFSKTNAYLQQHGLGVIDWKI